MRLKWLRTLVEPGWCAKKTNPFSKFLEPGTSLLPFLAGDSVRVMRVPPEMHHELLADERDRSGRTWDVDPMITFRFWRPMVPLANASNVKLK